MTGNFYDPLELARRGGGRGQVWAARCQGKAPYFAACEKAIQLLRHRRVQEAVETLNTVRKELHNIRGSTLGHVLGRFYFGALGYQEYVIGDYVTAHASMQRASASVAAAISAADFLLPFAHHCKELRLHQARIDRNRRCWSGMRMHIELARGMNEDRHPLCILQDGNPVAYRNLSAFFARLEFIDNDEKAEISLLLDPVRRRHLFDEFVRGFSDPPGFVLQYP